MDELSHDVENGQNLDAEPDDDDDGILDDDGSVFSTDTIADVQDCDIYGNPSARPSDAEASEAVKTWGNIESEVPPMLPQGAEITTPPTTA